MKLFENNAQCCGCGICADKCPKNAITLKDDAFGFSYPVIDSTLCVDCGLCTKVCAFTKRTEKHRPPLAAYAAASKDNGILSVSTSGGIFAELAKYILQQGGTVFGCAYDKKLRATHIAVTTEEDLPLLQGSKYVQSRTVGTYVLVKEYLNAGKPVLYSGTPCQVSALHSYLGKDYDNLYCADIICHGVGSPALFQEDIAALAQGERIKQIIFRDKRLGWGTHGRLVTDRRSIPFEPLTSPYYYYYLGGAIYRDSCYQCRYPSETRVGDITLGDYWRVESAHPSIEESINTRKGVSCVLVNSEKGLALLDRIRDKLNLVESDHEKMKARNGQLSHCCTAPANRMDILHTYVSFGYHGVIKYWKKHTKKQRIILRVKKRIPRSFKSALKRIGR